MKQIILKFSALKQKQVTFPLVQESGSGLARWFWLWVSHEVEVKLLSGLPTSGAQSRIWSQRSLRSSVLSSLPCSPLHLHDGGSSLSPNCVIQERERRLEMGASVFYNLFSNVTHHRFCHILLVIQTNSGTMWEGTSCHFGILLESKWQDVTIVLAIPLHTSQHPTEGKSDPVSFKDKRTFPESPHWNSTFHWPELVTCICLHRSLERGMGSWCWLKLGGIDLTHQGEKWI